MLSWKKWESLPGNLRRGSVLTPSVQRFSETQMCPRNKEVSRPVVPCHCVLISPALHGLRTGFVTLGEKAQPWPPRDEKKKMRKKPQKEQRRKFPELAVRNSSRTRPWPPPRHRLHLEGCIHPLRAASEGIGMRCAPGGPWG